MPYTKAQAKEKITKLVEDFRAHERTLERAPEAEIENSFIRPLFEALNWNTTNQGLSYAQYEFKVQATNKKGLRPDYVLQLDGRDVLVMDAKQVKYSMKDPRWLYQVYSYAYSTQNSKPSQKIDFAILTDFQEFIVLDCTLYAAKPEVVNNFRVIDWKYSDYVEQFDMLWDLFERQNVLNASRPHDGRGAVIAPNDKPIARQNDKPIAPNDKSNTPKEQDSSFNETGSVTRAGVPRPYGLWGMYLSPQKVKANRVAPDKAFLAQMDDEKDGWRVLLAKDMKKRNPRADGELITAAVQLLIDRLIFIKALSDREVDRDYLSEIESRVTESGLGENEAGWFASCKSIFEELNNFYNGSIFEPRPELENVSVGNRAVQAVLHDLQPENSPYNFAVLPVEILGTIYERFLGRVVRTTEKRVTIEDKPEVRKAGGVYYTPQYIVDYIVENTLGKLLAECKTPADVAKLKILDPSCGSGSFLLGAYSKLIDWHKDYYARVGKEKRDRASFYRDEGGLIRLTAKLKRDILKNNLYGVDIDPQAVEVTRFSLSLKALEDLREGELTEERTLFHQTVLPDLSENIKNGNSLIGTDYFTGQMFTDAEELKNVRPFDWNHEFKEIMSAGGFDCVIGNPPYVRIQVMKEWAPLEVEIYKEIYQSAKAGNYDIYVVFVEKALSILNARGRMGYILPHKFFNAQYGANLRGLVSKGKHLAKVIHFGDAQVFDGATTYTCLLFLDKTGNDEFEMTRVQDLNAWREQATFQTSEVLKTSEVSGRTGHISAENVTENEWNFTVGEGAGLVERLSKMPVKLDDIAQRIFQGFKTGADPVFILEEKGNGKYYSNALDKELSLEKSFLRPLYKSGEMKRYILHKNLRYVIFPYKNGSLIEWKELSKEAPKTAEYLMECKNLLAKRENGRWVGAQWYCYSRNQALEIISSPKILTADLNPFANYCFDASGEACLPGGAAGGYGIVLENNMYHYVLGLLNSKVVDYYHKKISTNFRGGWFGYDAKIIRNIPIRVIDFNKPDEKAQHDKMVALVEQMLSLHKSKAEAQTQSAQDAYERQIRAVDDSIDKLVYQLYGLTPEEVKIVET